MPSRRIFALAAGAFALLVSTGIATATEQTFKKPMFGAHRLDYCYRWAEGCGKVAADTFCSSQGFEQSSKFKIAEDIGGTQTIGDTSVCDNPDCDGFSSITCSKTTPATTFNDPRFMDAHLDWCYRWGADCGRPAADAFCQSKSFVRARDFNIAENTSPTRVMATTQKCTAPDCDSFASITCEN